MSDIESAGYEGFTFLKKNDVQPEVINPKTNKPFDLTDPEYPVVNDPNHKFKWSYWKMPKSNSTVMLEYLKDHWEYFNRTRFGGRLKMPHIELLRDVDALRMKLRGIWRGSSRVLGISPNLFNAPHEGWVNRVLIHEMCHQEVTELLPGTKHVEGGHGPEWKEAMHRAGLIPNRFDTENNETYADRHEKKRFAEINEKNAGFLRNVEILRATRSKITKPPKIGDKVLFATQNHVVFAVVRAKAAKAGSFSCAEKVDDTTEMTWTVTRASMYSPTYGDLRSDRYDPT